MELVDCQEHLDIRGHPPFKKYQEWKGPSPAQGSMLKSFVQLVDCQEQLDLSYKRYQIVFVGPFINQMIRKLIMINKERKKAHEPLCQEMIFS